MPDSEFAKRLGGTEPRLNIPVIYYGQIDRYRKAIDIYNSNPEESIPYLYSALRSGIDIVTLGVNYRQVIDSFRQQAAGIGMDIPDFDESTRTEISGITKQGQILGDETSLIPLLKLIDEKTPHREIYAIFDNIIAKAQNSSAIQALLRGMLVAKNFPETRKEMSEAGYTNLLKLSHIFNLYKDSLTTKLIKAKATGQSADLSSEQTNLVAQWIEHPYIAPELLFNFTGGAALLAGPGEYLQVFSALHDNLPSASALTGLGQLPPDNIYQSSFIESLSSRASSNYAVTPTEKTQREDAMNGLQNKFTELLSITHNKPYAFSAENLPDATITVCSLTDKTIDFAVTTKGKTILIQVAQNGDIFTNHPQREDIATLAITAALQIFSENGLLTEKKPGRRPIQLAQQSTVANRAARKAAYAATHATVSAETQETETALDEQTVGIVIEGATINEETSADVTAYINGLSEDDLWEFVTSGAKSVDLGNGKWISFEDIEIIADGDRITSIRFKGFA